MRRRPGVPAFSSAAHGLIGRRAPLPGLAATEALARPIDKDDAVTGGKGFGEREIHVLEIGAGAVQKNVPM